MSATLTNDRGAFNSQTGFLGVPSGFGSAVGGGGTLLNTLLQQYLDNVATSVTGGTASFANYDVANNENFTVGGRLLAAFPS